MSVYHDLTEHYNALQRWLCTPGKIINGIGYVFCKGEWICAKEYKKHNPKPSYEEAKPENPDGKNIPQSVKIRKYR